MSFKNLFQSYEHSRNLSHFAALVRIAAVDNELNEQEMARLDRFANKLGIHESEQKAVLKDPTLYPINPPNSHEVRLQLLHDMFSIIFADNQIDEDEHHLLVRYAAGLGFNNEQAEKYIKRSIQIYTGGLDFEDYQYLVEK
ncbi:TerB family tellurite resistance protein [Gilvibacter sp.]|uniref:TerB family tellurite resistance protein n=1 Tax=Gilvibacter sp. TaxID=2729997 RepID=UPI0025C225F2|nr:TerB family tellurite resistance protein [Gilvibacter sp.]NQX77071.1 TerB family tellurite resistance protein [Gilvibacter sp.]